jgi:hypothetical protein
LTQGGFRIILVVECCASGLPPAWKQKFAWVNKLISALRNDLESLTLSTPLVDCMQPYVILTTDSNVPTTVSATYYSINATPLPHLRFHSIHAPACIPKSRGSRRCSHRFCSVGTCGSFGCSRRRLYFYVFLLWSEMNAILQLSTLSWLRSVEMRHLWDIAPGLDVPRWFSDRASFSMPRPWHFILH